MYCVLEKETDKPVREIRSCCKIFLYCLLLLKIDAVVLKAS